MKKKIFIAAFTVAAMTSCSSLFQRNDDTYSNNHGNDNHYYGSNYNPGTPPPPPQGHGNNYQYNPGNQHVTQQTGSNRPGEHVTQTHGNDQQSNRYDYNDRGDMSRRPAVVGTILPELPPNRKVSTVTVNGEKLYLVDRVYYKLVRTNSGTGYKVVGRQD